MPRKMSEILKWREYAKEHGIKIDDEGLLLKGVQDGFSLVPKKPIESPNLLEDLKILLNKHNIEFIEPVVKINGIPSYIGMKDEVFGMQGMRIKLSRRDD